METISVQAIIRDPKVKINNFRKQGKIPGVVYGHKIKSLSLSLDTKNFQKVFKAAGESTLLSLEIAGEKQPRHVLIKGVQKEPVFGAILHVDFYEVKMTEKITAEIPLIFVGESFAVKDLSGILVKNIDQIEVSCLPQDLPHEIKVDITSLKTFDDLIHIQDLIIPANVEVTANPKDVVASITPPRSEEELAGLEEKVEEKVEAVGDVKKEEISTEESAEANQTSENKSK